MSASQHPLRRLLNYAAAYRPRIWWATFCTLLNKLFDILPESLIGVAVDVVVERENSWLSGFGIERVDHQLFLLAAVTGFIWVAESSFEYLFEVAWRNIAQNIQHDLRRDTYANLQNAELRFFETHQSGATLSILTEDINQLERFLNTGITQILQTVFGTVLVGVAFFVIAPKTAVWAISPIPVILYGAYWFRHRLEKRYSQVRQEASALSGLLSNNLGGIATIRAFGREEHELAHISAQSERYREANREAIAFASAITPVIRMAVMAGFIATLVVGGLMVLDGELPVGAYSVFVFLTQRLLWPLTRLAEVTDMYNRAIASVKRALDVLDIPAQPSPSTQPAEPIDFAHADIVLDNIGFEYVKGHPVLRNLGLQIEAGKTTAIVGATGGGKSTLMKLLLKFYEPSSGMVRAGTHDFAKLPNNIVRDAMGYVGQDVFLIDDTIAENIRYGWLAASFDDVKRAAELAEASDFVEGLPQGYETQVGERGVKLSGGQRQRIALARAIVRNPAILLLDEATSAVDNETEAAITRSLQTVSKGRTTIIIAHRLSTIRHADKIYVLQAGRVAESGTHDELAVADGLYKSLWKLQTGEGAAL